LFKYQAPNEQERLNLLKASIERFSSPAVDLESIARETAGYSLSDLKNLTKKTLLESLRRSMKRSNQLNELSESGIQILSTDVSNALKKTRKEVSEQIGAPKIPNVEWNDIGGLEHVKNTILETIQLPLMHPELFADGVKKRSGVLLYGPPGICDLIRYW
jgi:SpoVK/Ycf46/Vps4 family AAA+-type ATPase